MPGEISVLEVIAEPTRRRILDAVRDGERSVGELVEQVGMHQPGVSRHLKVLRDAGLVEVRRDAQRHLRRTATPIPPSSMDTGGVLRLSHFVTDPDAAIGNCYIVGLHTSLARLAPPIDTP